MLILTFPLNHYPWSHGLVMSVVWSSTVGVVACLLSGDRRSGTGPLRGLAHAGSLGAQVAQTKWNLGRGQMW
jgi:hypothetical protein